MSDRTEKSWLDRPIWKGIGLNREQGLYILIIAICLVSRLAMLGYRVQSHDESLHCKFSWDLYVGTGFQHNPMMHGPFLFHVTAFSYFLFGDTDFTARLPVALIGTALVALPYFLKRYLGRKGALMTSLLLLISPSILYYSRYIRHDIPALLWAMLIIWAMFRYLEGRDRPLYVLAAALSLLYATKEVAAIYTLIFAVFVGGVFVVRGLSRSWGRPRAELVFISALIAVAVGLVVLSIGWMAAPQPDPAALAEGAEPEGLLALPFWGLAGGIVALLGFLVAIGAILYGLWDQLHTFRSFDLIVVVGTLCLPFASPLAIHLASRLGALIVARYPSLESAPGLWVAMSNVKPTDYSAPAIYYSGAILGVVALVAVAIGVAWNWRRWLVAAAIHTAIFMVLFTTVFTNGGGIASGWVGSVGYWLEQQEVERGSQPAFYYLVVLPFYDFLPLLGALAGSVYLAVRGLLGLSKGDEDEERPPQVEGEAEGEEPPAPPTPEPEPWPSEAQARSLFLVFLVVWTFLAWFAYSYAGERMPWLVVHISLPMILLTGWLLGRLIEAVDWQKVREHRGWLLILLLPPLTAAVVVTILAGFRGPFGGVALNDLLVTGNFFGGLLGVALLGTLTWLIWSRVGLRNGLLLTSLTVFLVLGLLTVHVAYRFSFVTFDYPKEFLVYAHESPDVRTTMEQLEELSLRVGGGPRLIDVTYGPDGSWPFTWYLRDYPNARYYTEEPNRDQVLATAIIAGREQWGVVEPYLEDDYYTFDYFYLWWPMEDYRQLTWGRLWDWFTTPRKLRALWHIFYHMDYSLYDEITGGNHALDEWPLHSNFRLYVRKDVADQLWDFGAGPPSELTGSEVDPYTENRETLSARLVWGTEGSGSGQFSAPRGLAVSADGYVYVADSRNHRIQKFTTAGDFVTAWGSYGGCPDSEPEPGTFCEPWDVAVGPDGSVYVADTWADRVQKFTPDGAFLEQWTASGARDVYDFYGHSYFYGPRSLAVNAEGTVYVADTGHKRIQFFGPEGAFMGELGGPGSEPGQLDEPVGVAIGPEGRIYVADTWNYRVQVLESDGMPVLEWPIAGWNNASVEEKAYLAVDEEGRVYVTDPGHYRVLVFDSEGEYLYSFGQFGFDDASFSLPMGVALGSQGNLYVTDAGNNRVMVFDLPE